MNKNVLTTTLQMRRGSEAQWEAVKDSFIPAAGEPCVTLDGKNAGRLKIGDGVSAWGALKYSNGVDVIKVYGNTAEDTSMSVDGVSYPTAAEAIEAVSDGGTVKMSCGLGAGEVISVNKKLTLDMNSAVVVDNEKCPVEVGLNGELTLTGNGSVECNKHGQAAVSNNGKTIIENGNYTRTVDVKDDSYYTVRNHGEMVIESGVFEAPGVISSMIENGYYDYNSTNPDLGHVDGVNAAEAKLTINDGTFINGFHTVKNDDGAVTVINGGKFYGDILQTGKSMTINDGYFYCEDKANVYVRKINEDLNAGTLNITGGTFIASGVDFNIVPIYESAPTVKISGGKFNLEVPEGYLVDGYSQVYQNGYYVVTQKN